MSNDGILRAQHAIEAELKKQALPVKAGALLKEIRKDLQGVREIELRGAVWVLIGRGKVNLTPDWELVWANKGEPLWWD